MGQLTSDSSGRPLALLGAAAESGRWTDERMAASMIFVKGESAQQPLGEFVARVRVALGLTDVTEREGSNWSSSTTWTPLA